jgi:hypothetical protein
VKKTELMRKAFTPEEYDRYLDGPSLFPDADESKEELPVRKAVSVKTSATTNSGSSSANGAKAAPKSQGKKPGAK